MTDDALASLEAYDALLEIDPDDAAALNNSGNLLRNLTRYEEAQARLDRAVSGGGGASSVAFWNHARTRFVRGDTVGTLESIQEYRDRYPDHIYQPWADLVETMAVGEVGGIEGRTRAIVANPELAFLSRRAPLYVIAAEIGQGRIERALESADEISLQRGGATYRPIATGVSDVRFWLLDDSVGAIDALQEALRTRFDEIDVASRPWGEAVALFALAGRVDLASELLARWEAETPGVREPNIVSHQAVSRAMIDAGEGRYAIALEQLETTAREMSCPRCFEMQRAVVLEEMDRFGEAVTIWETVRDYPTQILESGFEHTVALTRLGPLHEANGDTTSAIAAYQEFAAAWADADATLQPQVSHARERIAALGG